MVEERGGDAVRADDAAAIVEALRRVVAALGERAARGLRPRPATPTRGRPKRMAVERVANRAISIL